ncbi:L,D-transpeptidase [Rhizobium sp. YIM 134829]|uniref:L,D-transpeptidase family protein n=1 Tax=Rhizobium sp. YIM 134829 TaxID=3390453 RepID=UPI00397D68BF
MAQSTYRLAPDAVIVTPQGEVLDYIPDSGAVRVMRDRQGRTVLVDDWGQVVGTVMGDRRRAARRQAPGGYGEEASGNGFDSGVTGAVRDYRDPNYRYGTGADPGFRSVVPPGVERSALPSGLPRDGFQSGLPPADSLPPADGFPQDENDMAALPPDSSMSEPRIQLPPAAAITRKTSAEITALQVFLDREGFSPGVIDGKTGSNVTKAIEAWQQATGETLDPNNTEDILERLRLSGGLPFTTYTITAADAAGPYVASIPEDYAHKAELPHLSFTSVPEMLGEKFHMDETYLRAMNPGVDFTIPGTIVKVINPGAPKTGTVTRILADKARKQVFAYDANGGLVAAYPATIGSSDTPSPSGTVQVDRIALNPGYTYNPKINFKQGNNDKVLTLQPGPNGPVGTVWIALSKPTYGIHGTPEPSKIGKTQSHGCVRLTNWDATELAKMVSVGTVVEFVD